MSASSSTVAGLRNPQPKLRIGLLAVGFGRLDQAVKLSTGRCAFGRIAEQPVLSSDHEGPDRTLGGIVIDRQVAFLYVPFQFVPIACQVADGFAESVLSSDLWSCLSIKVLTEQVLAGFARDDCFTIVVI